MTTENETEIDHEAVRLAERLAETAWLEKQLARIGMRLCELPSLTSGLPPLNAYELVRQCADRIRGAELLELERVLTARGLLEPRA